MRYVYFCRIRDFEFCEDFEAALAAWDLPTPEFKDGIARITMPHPVEQRFVDVMIVECPVKRVFDALRYAIGTLWLAHDDGSSSWTPDNVHYVV